MFEVDMQQVIRMANDLEIYAEKAFPFAVRNTVNRAAFQAREKWQNQIEERFTLRNKFTRGSIRVDRAKGRDVDTMEASVGSVAPYLADQESGTTLSKQGKHGHPIPSSVASGEGRGTAPRRRVVRKPNLLQNIELERTGRGRLSRKVRNFVEIKQARESGRKFVFLELDGGRKGIYRVSGRGGNTKLDLIWDVSRPAVRIPKTPTLEPALDEVEPKLFLIYRDAIREQLIRNKVLWY